MQRFLVGSRDTSHFNIIPVLGYTKQVVISAMTYRGGTVGARGVCAKCSPWAAPVECHRERREGGWTRLPLFQLQSAPRLADRALAGG
jgi:hypothetical protein